MPAATAARVSVVLVLTTARRPGCRPGRRPATPTFFRRGVHGGVWMIHGSAPLGNRVGPATHTGHGGALAIGPDATLLGGYRGDGDPSGGGLTFLRNASTSSTDAGAQLQSVGLGVGQATVVVPHRVDPTDPQVGSERRGLGRFDRRISASSRHGDLPGRQGVAAVWRPGSPCARPNDSRVVIDLLIDRRLDTTRVFARCGSQAGKGGARKYGRRRAPCCSRSDDGVAALSWQRW